MKNAIVCLCLGAGWVMGQGRGGPEWTTGGNDAQRSSWVRSDEKISRESMAKPGRPPTSGRWASSSRRSSMCASRR